MYRAVMIICFIAAGCAAGVSNLRINNRQLRQEPSQVPTSNVYQTQNMTQSPYSNLPIPTYPEYTNGNHVTELSAQEQGATVATPVETTTVVESPSIVSRLLPYARNFVQYLLAILISTSIVSLLCTYTPLCNANFLGIPNLSEVRGIARSTSPNLNDIGTLVMNSIGKFSAMQPVQE